MSIPTNKTFSEIMGHQQGVAMKVRHLVIFACLAGAGPALANNASPSEQSIEELLTLTNVRQLFDQMKFQVDSTMTAAVREAQQGQTVTPERQAILDRMKDKMTAVVHDAISWETLVPIYVRTYQASLTQDELDGMIKFYKSPAGQAFTKKMPLIMQNVMAEMQGIMKPMQQKIAEIQKQTIQELKDLKSSQGAATSQGGSTS
jgi:uncharacterized protein